MVAAEQDFVVALVQADDARRVTLQIHDLEIVLADGEEFTRHGIRKLNGCGWAEFEARVISNLELIDVQPLQAAELDDVLPARIVLRHAVVHERAVLFAHVDLQPHVLEVRRQARVVGVQVGQEQNRVLRLQIQLAEHVENLLLRLLQVKSSVDDHGAVLAFDDVEIQRSQRVVGKRELLQVNIFIYFLHLR